MRQTPAIVAAWLVGTFAAVALGVEAVEVVTASVTERRPAPLSKRGVVEALAGTPAGASEAPAETGQVGLTAPPTAVAPGTTPDSPAGPVPRSGAAAVTATTKPAGVAGTIPRPVSTAPTIPPSNESPVTSTPSPPPTTAPSAPTTTAPPTPSPAPEDRTYSLVGGTVGVRFENREAHLLWASPKPGFTFDSSGSSSRVDMRFTSEDHESRLKAYWNDGPRAEVEEIET